MNIQSIAKKEI